MNPVSSGYSHCREHLCLVHPRECSVRRKSHELEGVTIQIATFAASVRSTLRAKIALNILYDNETGLSDEAPRCVLLKTLGKQSKIGGTHAHLCRNP